MTLNEKQLTSIEQTAQIRDHKPYPDNAVELGSDVVMMMVEEIRDYRAHQAETRPVIDRVHEYVHKYDVSVAGTTGDVVDMLRLDAERLRAEVERQAAEIAELREEVASLRGINVGDTVIVTEAITEDDESRVGKTGKVTQILEGHSIFAYVVDFGSKAVRMDKNQLKRIDTTLDTKPDAAPVEPAPAEIKVGDAVRIVKSGELRERVGTVIQIATPPTGNVFVVRIWGGYTLDFTRDEIEPA